MLTFAIIAVTVLVSWLAFERPRLLDRLLLWPPAIDRQRQWDRLVTHGFVHADWMHLLFNMITLYFFGRVIEQVMSRL
ncbi:rhomboid family intramembrane serine protease, partial [Acinetobacter baumannii]